MTAATTREVSFDDFYANSRAALADVPEPPGVRVRANGVDVYWPSWAAWRYGQGSPEHVWLRDADPVYQHHQSVTENHAFPVLPHVQGAFDSIKLPANKENHATDDA